MFALITFLARCSFSSTYFEYAYRSCFIAFDLSLFCCCKALVHTSPSPYANMIVEVVVIGPLSEARHILLMLWCSSIPQFILHVLITYKSTYSLLQCESFQLVMMCSAQVWDIVIVDAFVVDSLSETWHKLLMPWCFSISQFTLHVHVTYKSPH